MVKVHKSPGFCDPCNRVMEYFSKVKDAEVIADTNGSPPYPQIDVYVEKNGQLQHVSHITGALFSQIDSALATAKQRAR